MMRSVSISVCVLFAVWLFAGFASPRAHAQGVVMTNVNFEQTYAKLKITYDLVGEDDGYDIRLMLRKKDDPSYSYAPKGMRGDIGDDVAPGRGKVIEWDLAEDFPNGIDPSAQLALRFEAGYSIGFFQKYTPYLVGAAAAVGATVYFLLSGEEEPSEFPDPSGRPGEW